MKKIISMVLALVMMFAISATAFAANDAVGSLPQHEHDWGDWAVFTWGRMRVCEDCGVTEIIYFEESDGADEENPETGAFAGIGMAVLVSAAAVSSFKRGK